MYGCPGCGAELRYDIKTGRLRCKSCGGKIYSADNTIEVYSGSNTIAGFCSYCGASAILQQRTEKVEAPKSIVPFKIEKRVCKTKFKNFAKKNMYVPDEYKKADGINEFRGIYLPYHRE